MELTAYGNYQQYKQELDTELRKTTEGFVKIGYLLKVAKDTDILKESGYANVYEFAQAEYNIDKSQVSRFMNINDRFSEGGYSDRLKEEFRGFGHAKLTIMLQLPDEINEELTQQFSKSEIQAIKEEFDEERNISDIEVLIEGQDERISALDNNLYKAIWQIGKDFPDIYIRLHKNVGNGERAAYEILAPEEEKIYSVRIQGVGRLMLSIKEMDKKVTLTNIRSMEKEEYTWQDVMECIEALIISDVSQEESWSTIYGEEFPKKEEVAPVQPNVEKKKESPKKETKVQKAKKPEPKKPEPKPEPDEQIPGQDNIMNHPEYLPAQMQESLQNENSSSLLEESQPENVTGHSEIVETTPVEEQQAQIMQSTVSEQPAAVVEEIKDKLEKAWDDAYLAMSKLNLFFENWDSAEAAEENIPTESLKNAYKNATCVAANLERMLNHGKI